MKCDYDPCTNQFDVPEVTIVIADRTQGASWGYYCGHQCAKNDSQQALVHLANGNSLESIPNVTQDAPEVNQPVATVASQPSMPAAVINPASVPNLESLSPFAEEGETTQAVATEDNEGNPIQTAWDHVVENTPPSEGESSGGPQQIQVQPLADAQADHARNIGNELVQLFCGNLGFQASATDVEPGFRAIIAVGREGVNFHIRLTDDNKIQIYFGEGVEANVEINPNDPNVNMGEAGPFLLQRVGDNWQRMYDQHQIAASIPQVGF